LYVGKAKNVRSRVQTHVGRRPGASAFAGWTEQIARVEARRAYSDLEALLVEAELIRRLRPPFNRQMRLWSRYWYLRANGEPYGQLSVCRTPGARETCFGPFRSRRAAEQTAEASAAFFRLAACPPEDGPARQHARIQREGVAALCQRYFAGLCAGPCAARVAGEEYQRRIRQRDALLEGIDDSGLAAAETALERAERDAAGEAGSREMLRRVRVLCSAFNHAVTLRQAEALLDGLLLLPGPGNESRVALLSREGVRFEQATSDCARGRAASGVSQSRAAAARRARLPRHSADCLCLAARELRRNRGQYVFKPAQRSS
jgi:excinuclease ABC subunit C